ncbi:MAG: BrnT family toxin [Syntrophobacteraceae bacterium]|jgi:uncharacterized DUF497 family protein
MNITYDPAKRAKTIEERGLDFEDVPKVFSGPTVTDPDVRRDYGEERFITFGVLDGREVALVWTPRGDGRRIISMRYANEREIAIFQSRVD